MLRVNELIDQFFSKLKIISKTRKSNISQVA
jgi:hypothetical protein